MQITIQITADFFILSAVQSGNDKLEFSKIQDALQLRGALESKAAFLAAQNCTPLDAAELQLIIARLDRGSVRQL